MTYHIRHSCRLCEGRIETVLDLGETALANEFPAEKGPQATYPLYLAQCLDCGHVQLPVVVAPELLFPADYPYVSGTAKSHVIHLKSYARSLLPYVPRGGLVVEIGSNDGTMLRAFQDMGRQRVIGVDPALDIATAATEAGIPTYPVFFSEQVAESIVDRHGYASLIVANHVFAHSDDLQEILRGVSQLLIPTGRFIFEVQYLPLQLERGHWDNIYHEHLSYHHLAPLQALLLRHGLRVFDAHETEVHGGGLRVYAERGDIHSPRVLSPRAVRLLEKEKHLTRAAFEELQQSLHDQRERLAIQVGGAPFYCFGAPAKFATRAAVLGFERHNILGVFDDNARKVGRLTPGTQFPVLPSPELSALPGASVLLTAWNYPDIQKRFPQANWIH